MLLGIKLKDKIRNEEIYKRSHQTPITTEIKKRRLNWLGHKLRLPERTPAKLAFRELLKKQRVIEEDQNRHGSDKYIKTLGQYK